MRGTWSIILTAAVMFSGCDGMKELVEKVGTEKAKNSGALDALKTATSGSVVTVTAANFDAVVDQPGKLVVVDFWAPWCGPCVQLSPVLEEMAGTYGDSLVIAKVNVDEESSLAVQHQVRGIPDLHFYRDGKRVDRKVGAPPRTQLMAIIESHLPSTNAPAPAEDRPVTETAGESPEDPAPQPIIQPMKKGWMPPGLERR